MARQKRTFTPAQKAAYIKAFHSSGMALDAWAKQQELTASAFRLWCVKAGEPTRSKAAATGAAPGDRTPRQKRTAEQWEAIMDTVATDGVPAACKKHKISDASVYNRLSRLRAKGESPVVASGKVAKKASKKNGLARRKPEQTNLIPVIEHEPVQTPAFEAMQTEAAFESDANDIWDRLNAILVKHVPASERVQVFGLVHRLMES